MLMIYASHNSHNSHKQSLWLSNTGRNLDFGKPKWLYFFFVSKNISFNTEQWQWKWNIGWCGLGGGHKMYLILKIWSWILNEALLSTMSTWSTCLPTAVVCRWWQRLSWNKLTTQGVSCMVSRDCSANDNAGVPIKCYIKVSMGLLHTKLL